ncbi:WxL protein host-binding domain-containing protein [Brochothrix campestris]|uniref:DUF3324 domain-containing protein n=1 Tax=Brochothrix campestris TaxID=2757 RepID=UPI0038D1EA2C
MKNFLVAIVFISMFIGGGNVYASDNKGPMYTVTPVLPENQQKNITDQFDLLVKPGSTQIIQVILKNKSKKAMQLNSVVVAGVTNSNGIIDYKNKVEQKKQKDTFTNIATADEAGSIAAQSEKTLNVEVKIPMSGIDGLMLGGIKIEQVSAAKSESNIQNKYSYIIPIKLQTKTDQQQAKLNLKKVTISQTGLRNRLVTVLENPKGAILRNIEMSLQVQKDKTDTTYYENKKNNLKFAPKSTADLQWALDKPFEVGTYQVTLKVIADGFEKTWTEALTIDKEEADTLNATSVDEKEKNTNSLKMYILLGIIAVLILMIIIILLKKNKQRNEVE